MAREKALSEKETFVGKGMRDCHAVRANFVPFLLLLL